MKPHPFLRAYLAGIAVPTLFLLVVLTAVVGLRQSLELPVPIERFAVFPMALVPNAWGLWNVLRVASAGARRLPLGLYGALLAAILPVLGYGVARIVGFELPLAAATLGFAWLVACVVYYLVWEHVVGFLNELLGVAS